MPDSSKSQEEYLKHNISIQRKRDEIIKAISKKSFVIEDDKDKHVPGDTEKLFSYNVEGNKVIMLRYLNHPWFELLEKNEQDLIKKFSESENSLSNEDFQEFINQSDYLWRIFLQALVLALGHSARGDDKQDQKLIDKVLNQLGKISEEFVDRIK